MKCKDMMFRKALLPILEKPLDDQCRSTSHNMHCFKGGDSRTNEQPGTQKQRQFLSINSSFIINQQFN